MIRGKSQAEWHNLINTFFCSCDFSMIFSRNKNVEFEETTFHYSTSHLQSEKSFWHWCCIAEREVAKSDRNLVKLPFWACFNSMYSWFQETVPSVYTLIINTIYLSQCTQVPEGTIYKKHAVCAGLKKEIIYEIYIFSSYLHILFSKYTYQYGE